MCQSKGVGRLCFRPPIPEIAIAAEYLDQAVTAHLTNKPAVAEELIRRANIPQLKNGHSRFGEDAVHTLKCVTWQAHRRLFKAQRGPRMPTADTKRLLHGRDGYHCRFCGIPVIRKEIRVRLKKFYPDVLPWEGTVATQHAAFEAMWAQYDHIMPHARGGTNDAKNMVVACAPCNFGRMEFTLEQVGLADPRLREPVPSAWEGLERLLVSRF